MTPDDELTLTRILSTVIGVAMAGAAIGSAITLAFILVAEWM